MTIKSDTCTRIIPRAISFVSVSNGSGWSHERGRSGRKTGSSNEKGGAPAIPYTSVTQTHESHNYNRYTEYVHIEWEESHLAENEMGCNFAVSIF
ncbi:hypothetical protein TNCT_572571 [Trichonephila clavata]|uniref:Uncharacterized protein n=1 Tax=Trichonephila clavata TaxID=2740835 RepID=A0A8X6GLI4_TRICU|nr:hypothetical protein TNCT_572571 [Trichonephila clavata]